MAAPNFTQPLEPVSVTEGQPAVFRAVFSGQPNPVVKWYRYSFPVHDSKDFKIFTTDTESILTIAKTCADDSGVFTCLLENIVGAAKSSSNLNVMESGQEYVMQVSCAPSS
jgi:titin